jgi:hypothetical protein
VKTRALRISTERIICCQKSWKLKCFLAEGVRRGTSLKIEQKPDTDELNLIPGLANAV